MTGNLGDRKAFSWWRDLNKLGASVNRHNQFFNNIMWELGDGTKIRLWEDIWSGSIALKDRFPILYSMSLETGKAINEVTKWVNVEGREVLSWKFIWRRELFEWEKE